MESFWGVGSHVHECGSERPYLMISKKKGLPAVLLHAFALSEKKRRESQSPSIQVLATSKCTFNTVKQKVIPSLTGFGCMPLTSAFM